MKQFLVWFFEPLYRWIATYLARSGLILTAAGYEGVIAVSSQDGPTLTAAAAASCLPVGCKYTFAPNGILLPSYMDIEMFGRISCVVTTPGTARLDVRLGGTVIFDTGALNLNIVAKTTLPWWARIIVSFRAIGSSANAIGIGCFASEAVIASPLGTAGGIGLLLSSVSGGPETAPAVGNNVDITAANALDVYFTQTVTTGSFTVHGCKIKMGAPAVA